MKYRAAIMDIDGTLMNFERPYVTAECVETVKKLRERGVTVIVATGRGPNAASKERLSGLEYDYLVCVNGALVLDNAGETAHEDPITEEQINELLALGERENACIAFTFRECYCAYLGYERMQKYYDEHTSGTVRFVNGETRDRHKTALPLGAFTLVDDDAAERLNDDLSELKLVKFKPEMYDIVKKTGDKAKTLSLVLDRIGVPWDEVAAIGDGENDVAMLKRAGLGVAMGNAPDCVKAAADEVTDDVPGDGVTKALRRIFEV